MRVNKILKQTKRYQIVQYRDPDGTVRQRKVMHKTNRVAWERIIVESQEVA